MSTRAGVGAIWTLAGLLAFGLLAATAGPMAITWRCYTLNASGERAEAEVVHKLDSPIFVLQIAAGPNSDTFKYGTTKPAR
jgi:hypothetical protein